MPASKIRRFRLVLCVAVQAEEERSASRASQVSPLHISTRFTLLDWTAISNEFSPSDCQRFFFFLFCYFDRLFCCRRKVKQYRSSTSRDGLEKKKNEFSKTYWRKKGNTFPNWLKNKRKWRNKDKSSAITPAT